MELLSGLSIDIAPQEMLVRFAWQSNQIAGGVAKRRLFAPRGGETSVYRRDEEPRAGLLESAIVYELKSGNTVRAAVLLIAQVPQRLGLHVVAAEPPPHHAAICGWAAGGDEVRAQNDERARLIAAEARVVPFSTRG